jgi:hypothetical protein
LPPLSPDKKWKWDGQQWVPFTKQEANALLPWYLRSGFVLLMLLFISPLGLLLIWLKPTFSVGKKIGWTLLIGVPILLIELSVLGSVGASGDQSATLQQSIMSTGAAQIKSALKAVDPNPNATVSMNDASCVQSAGTQNYTCIAHYTVNDPSAGLNNQRYMLNITGTCDASASCIWHATGNGNPVGA